MNCSQCQTELPDTATFCPSCGASMRQPSQPGFSYLPPGTPPWPMTIPQKIPYLANTAPEPQFSKSATANQESKPRRSPGSVLLAIGLLILIPLLGAGATLGVLYARGQFPPNNAPQPHVAVPVQAHSTPVATGTPAASTQGDQLPTPASQKKVSNTDVNLSLKYPSDWITDPTQKSSDSNSIEIHPQQQLGIGFIAFRFSDATSTSITSPNEINQARISALASGQGISNMQIVPSPSTQPKIAGQTWAQQDATFTDSNGNKIHLITISVQHKKTYYNVVLFSPDVYYNEAMRKYLQPMLDSMQFLS